jgi:hypothetical protein
MTGRMVQTKNSLSDQLEEENMLFSILKPIKLLKSQKVAARMEIKFTAVNQTNNKTNTGK